MGFSTVPRSMAKLEYSAARLPFTLLEEHVVARYWDDEASVRLGFERFLGSLDGFAGRLLADGDICRRGRALLRRAEFLAKADELDTKAQARRAPAEDKPQAEQAQARQAREQAHEDKPDLSVKPAADSTVDVTFTLPAEVQADSVALCGEFNEWSAENIRLERDGDGSWRATVALEPGHSYRYRYLLDGERWENAWQADGYVLNSYGSDDSIVRVD